MTQLTPAEYFARRQQLKEDWDAGGYRLSLIPPASQWYLHEFYAPSRSLSVQQLLARRVEVTARNRDLPRRASIAFRQFLETGEGRQPNVTSIPYQSGRRLRVHSLVNPEPNTRRIAELLLRMARRQFATSRADDASTTPARPANPRDT
jgi:hypothetical protein